MKKFLVACALALVVLGGTATGFILASTHAAYADASGNGGGH